MRDPDVEQMLKERGATIAETRALIKKAAMNWKPRHRSALVVAAVLTLGLVALGIGSAFRSFDTPRTLEGIDDAARQPEVGDHPLTPERHGPYLFVPQGWRGDLEAFIPVAGSPPPTHPSNDTAEVKSSPLWRDPALPAAGVTLRRAWAESVPLDARGEYVDADGRPAFSTTVWRPSSRPIRVDVWADNGTRLFEYGEVHGLAAVTWRTPADGKGEFGVRVFDELSGIEYIVQIANTSKFTQNDGLAIVRSMLP